MFPKNFNPSCSSIQFDPATALILATVVGAGSQIAGGISANSQAKDTARQQEEQARIGLQESNRAAEQKSNERRKFLAEQRMAYLANGVSLSGTPGIVGGDTFDEFQMELDAIRRSGVAQFKYGMQSANNTRANGRAQLISGFLSGASTAASGFSKAGLLDKKATQPKSEITWRDI